METMQDVESSAESSEVWESGQDSLQSAQDISSLESGQSVESSLETFSTTEQDGYSKGMFTEFSGEGIYGIMGTGVIVGFAVSIFLGFITKWIADTMLLFGKGDGENG